MAAAAHPESVHLFLLAFGDRGIPASYRTMVRARVRVAASSRWESRRRVLGPRRPTRLYPPAVPPSHPQNGYGNHSFRVTNEAGDAHYVKFHLKAHAGSA